MQRQPSGQRPYNSGLRQQQQDLTHQRIMAAVTELVCEGRIHSFSIQEVADRAGVSYGSVYRHFPTREALLEGLYEWNRQIAVRAGISPPGALQDIPAYAQRMSAFSEAHDDETRAAVMALIALGLVPQSVRATDEAFRRLVAEAAPDLPPGEVRLRAAVLRYLASSLGWTTLRQRFGLDAGETAAALNWALKTLIREIGHEARTGAEGHEARPGAEKEGAT